MAIDVGKARIGVARSDVACALAVPERTVARLTGKRGPDRADIDELVELIASYSAVEVIVGLPTKLDGSPGDSARDAADIAFRLGRRLPGLPIRLWDERFTTVSATRQLHEAGRKTHTHRQIIDQVAAVEILNGWLDARRLAAEGSTEQP